MPRHKLITDAARHRLYVDRSTTPEGCWPWTSATGTRGYGIFNAGSYLDGTRRQAAAHKFALEQALGRPVVPGMYVLHTCDNPLCCRNEPPGLYELNGVLRPCYGHLFEGTDQDNRIDRRDKGRDNAARGEAVAGAKLTEEAIREIRRRYAAGELQRSLAREFGVMQSAISSIVNRKLWRHVA